jgi:putative transposase
LGFHLLPRLKAIHRQKLYRSVTGEPDAYPNLQAILRRPIRWHLIRQQYDQMIKYATALRVGTADVETILKRFTRSQFQHPTYVGDITCIWTAEGWLYLAVVIDLFSRAVVGWSMSRWLKAELVTIALQMALDQRRPRSGLVMHTDRGSQYVSDRYLQLLHRHGIKPSMSRKANCWANAVAESFFHTLKTECVYLEHFENREQAQHVIFDYIEVFYNRQRRHSANGYLPPMVYEEVKKAA